MVSVTFDSNVWENIVDEQKRRSNTIYQELYELIESGQITPFFFEGLAVLESIPKDQRKDYMANFRATITVQANDEEPRTKKGTAASKPTDYLARNIPAALRLGFRFIGTPRIGAPSLDIPDEYRAPDAKYPLEERVKRTFECGRYIERLGAGRGKLDSRLGGDRNRGIVQRTRTNKTLSSKQFAKDVGEWADGDALAAHYGYGIDFFCTNDQAGSAGTASVFSKANREKLREVFGIRIGSPQELLTIVNEKIGPNGSA